MIQWIKSKLVLLIIGFVALLAAVGGSGIAFAQAHVSTATHQSSPTATMPTPGNTQQNTEDLHITGVIQSIDTTTRTVVLLLDGKTQTRTISFDEKTRIEQAPLTSGSHVLVEGIQQPQGVLYATEIQPVSQGNQGQSGNNGGNGDNDQNDDHGHDSGDHD